MIYLPIQQGRAFFQHRAELEGTYYVLDFAWNERAGLWFMSVLTDAGDPRVHGIAIVARRLLLRRFKYRGGLPPGDLAFIDLTGTIAAPDFTQLNRLVYYTEAEIAEARA